MANTVNVENRPSIALVDLRAEREFLGRALEDAVLAVLESGQYILGPEVERFERDFAALHDAPYAIGVGSGTDALLLALRALGVGPGTAVLTTPFTFFSSAAAIPWLGGRVVLADIDPRTGLIDPERAAEAMDGVSCILPVHLYGQLADMQAIRALADAHGASVVEDAAQAHGARRDGQAAGALADIACFSFYPTKNLGCAGEGGAVLTRRQDVLQRMRRLRDHGSGSKYRHVELGTNSRLDALQAAVLSAKLPHLERWNARRRELARRYDAAFGETDAVVPIAVEPGSEPAFHQYAVRLPAAERDRVRDELLAAGIASAVHYPVPVHLQPAAAEWGYPEGSLPEAEALAREVLCLPVHPFLEDGEVDRVAETLLHVLG